MKHLFKTKKERNTSLYKMERTEKETLDIDNKIFYFK